MKNGRSLLLLTLALIAVLAGAGGLYNRLSGGGVTAQGTPGNPAAQETADEEKTPAPDFTVYDGEGNPVRLSDFSGMPVVLNFWASWCGPCKSEMPTFEAAFTEYGGEICFMMVNLTDGSRETVDSAQAYIGKEGYTFPVYFDTDSEAAEAYGVRSVPFTYFIDPEGFGIAYAIGALSEETLQMGIDMLLPGT